MGYNKAEIEQGEQMPTPLELNLFCQWFEGKFDNWEQASSNPTKWAHIYITHERVDERKFLTSSRYNYSNKPYREQEVEITQPHVIGDHVGIIIVKNPACDMIFGFDKDNMCFEGISEEGCTYKGKSLESKAKLYADYYHTWDKGYWHGSEGFFLFKKKL